MDTCRDGQKRNKDGEEEKSERVRVRKRNHAIDHLIWGARARIINNLCFLQASSLSTSTRIWRNCGTRSLENIDLVVNYQNTRKAPRGHLAFFGECCENGIVVSHPHIPASIFHVAFWLWWRDRLLWDVIFRFLRKWCVRVKRSLSGICAFV